MNLQTNIYLQKFSTINNNTCTCTLFIVSSQVFSSFHSKFMFPSFVALIVVIKNVRKMLTEFMLARNLPIHRSYHTHPPSHLTTKAFHEQSKVHNLFISNTYCFATTKNKLKLHLPLHVFTVTYTCKSIFILVCVGVGILRKRI